MTPASPTAAANRHGGAIGVGCWANCQLFAARLTPSFSHRRVELTLLGIRRDTLRDDIVAGTVLGIESVPDGLSFGVLAGVNPLAGLYGYMYGTIGGALFSSSTVMAVQVTGAMSIIVADTNLDATGDPARALYTLSIMAGVLMVVAGLMHAGALLRFVPRSVMVGFIAGVGVNTVLGQLNNFTGYEAVGANRVTRTFNLALNIHRVDPATVTVGMLTLVLIVGLQKTRLGALGLVVAVAIGSAVAAVFSHYGHHVVTVGDLTSMPNGLPFIAVPAIKAVPGLIVPAFALAFVGMVQGAGVATAFPNPDGTPTSSSRDFVGQGTGSILSGLFRGMPAGGSMSATALVVAAGAKTRMALFVAGAVMAITIVAFSGVVAHVALPALAGLLIVIGLGTIRPADIRSAIKSGRIQASVVVATFALTILIPVPQAVLAGVALAVVLYVIEQSNRLVIRQLHLDDHGHIRESDPPNVIPPNDVVILQPYGSLFFASRVALRRPTANRHFRDETCCRHHPHQRHRQRRSQCRQCAGALFRRAVRSDITVDRHRQRRARSATVQQWHPRPPRRRQLLHR